jgi:hypothetical protein
MTVYMIRLVLFPQTSTPLFIYLTSEGKMYSFMPLLKPVHYINVSACHLIKNLSLGVPLVRPHE